MVETTPATPVSENAPQRPRASRIFGAMLIVVLIAAWMGYLFWVSGVLAHQERYPGGGVKVEGFLKRTGWSDYKRHGLWTTYHPNEKTASQGRYELGHKVGEWKYWDEKGEPVAGPTTDESDN